MDGPRGWRVANPQTRQGLEICNAAGAVAWCPKVGDGLAVLTMIGRLMEAVDTWPQFDEEDEAVSGADLVEWFGEWRERVVSLLGRDVGHDESTPR